MSQNRTLGLRRDREPAAKPQTNISKPVHAKVPLSTAHFHVLVPQSNPVCSVCNVGISKQRNCPKCGLLLCQTHLPKYPMRVSNSLECVPYDVDPNNLSTHWVRCCQICLDNCPAWSQAVGLVQDRTSQFLNMRSNKTRSEDLDKLIIERRLDKLMDWIYTTVQSAGSVDRYKLNAFESSLVQWLDGASCQECSTTFGFFSRKHHCRLCGHMVCDTRNSKTNQPCSITIPLNILCQILGKPEISQRLKTDTNFIRVCSSCRKLVLDKPVFVAQQKSQNTPWFRLTSQWTTLKSLILREDLNNVQTKNQSNRILNLFSKVESLSKEIVQLCQSGKLQKDEAQILLNVQLMIQDFVQEYLPQFRKAQQEALLKEQKLLEQAKPIVVKPLLKRDIRILREKLMVLNEQKFMVEKMVDDAKRERRFVDMKTLEENLVEISREIQIVEEKLGSEGFS